jgi:Flp pilus assembly protein TadG
MTIHTRPPTLLDRLREHATGTGEDGMVTAFTVIVTAALIILAGLVLDGGLALSGKVQALDEAQEAARAGAQELNLSTFRSQGQAVLDPSAAVAAAQSYLNATGDTGTVSVTRAVVTVSVTHQQRTQILSLVGISRLSTTATASATAEQGD